MGKQPFDSSKKFLKHVDHIRDYVVDGDTKGPVFIEINLANACNLKCEWCFCAHYNRDSTVLDYQWFYDFCNEFKHLGGKAMTFAGGGESTIHPLFMRFVEQGAHHKIEMALITNGVKDFTYEETEYLSTHLKWIRYSIDTVIKDEFIEQKGSDKSEKTLENLKRMYKITGRTARIGVCCNVMPGHDIFSLSRLISETEEITDYIQFRPMLDKKGVTVTNGVWDWLKNIARDNKKIILSLDKVDDIEKGQMLEGPCVGSCINPILDADGTIRVCMYHPHDERFELGNIYKDSLEVIWKSRKRKEVMDWLVHQNLRELGCQPGCKLTELNKFLNSIKSDNVRDVNFL
jgi:cyclic pyranopterin phosphate synthase